MFLGMLILVLKRWKVKIMSRTSFKSDLHTNILKLTLLLQIITSNHNIQSKNIICKGISSIIKVHRLYKQSSCKGRSKNKYAKVNRTATQETQSSNLWYPSFFLKKAAKQYYLPTDIKKNMTKISLDRKTNWTISLDNILPATFPVDWKNCFLISFSCCFERVSFFFSSIYRKSLLQHNL